MHEQPTLADYDIVLWKIKPSDIDDRLQIGRHHEFIHMCGGETWEKPDYPDRKYWADWYESHKGIVLATLGVTTYPGKIAPLLIISVFLIPNITQKGLELRQRACCFGVGLKRCSGIALTSGSWTIMLARSSVMKNAAFAGMEY